MLLIKTLNQRNRDKVLLYFIAIGVNTRICPTHLVGVDPDGELVGQEAGEGGHVACGKGAHDDGVLLGAHVVDGPEATAFLRVLGEPVPVVFVLQYRRNEVRLRG